MQILHRFILFLLVLSLFACKKDQSNTPVEKTIKENKFFPLKVGSWLTYEIEQITIDNEVDVNDTVHYQIKEFIESISDLDEDSKSYRLERYFRHNDSEEWIIKDVWQIKQFYTRIHKIEENIEFLKMISPLEEGDTWNGNAYNSLGHKEYEVESIRDTIINTNFLEKATIVQIDQSSLIDKIYSAEEYIEGIGLVNKVDIDVELNIDPNQIWEDKVSKGQIYRQSLIEFSEQITTTNNES
jgi:hypothetical protein